MPKRTGNREGLIKIDGTWLQVLKDNVNNIQGLYLFKVISQKIKSLLKLVNRIIEKHIPYGASFFPEGIFRAFGVNHLVTSAYFLYFTKILFDPYNQTVPGMAGIQHIQAPQLIKLPPSSARGEPAWRKKWLYFKYKCSTSKTNMDIFCEVALNLNSH